MRLVPSALIAAPRACVWLALCGLLLPTASRAYELEGARWPSNKPIVMYVQLGSTPQTLSDGSQTWNDVAKAALAIWNPCLGSGVQFTVGATTIPNVQGDHNNSVFFSSSAYGSSFGDDAIAVTVYRTNSTNTQFQETDVIVNNAYTFDSYRGENPTSKPNDLRRVLLHEFGHVLGLDHVPQGSLAIMQPVISGIDTIMADDIAGAEAIYGSVAGNHPVITSGLSATAFVNQAFQYQITASNSPISYSATGLPGDLDFDAATGVISGTVDAAAGDNQVTLTATNAAGSGTATLLLKILAPPVITSPTQVTVPLNQPFTYQIKASGTVNSYLATGYGGSVLPAGFTVNTATGLVSGVLQPGGATLVVGAKNAAGTSTEQVTFTPAPSAPVVTGLFGLNAQADPAHIHTGTNCIFIVSVTGAATSYGATGLPPGLTLSPYGQITGTPTKVGTYTATLTATNNVGTGTYLWTVEVGQTIALTSGAITGQVGVPLTYQITGNPMPTNFQFGYVDDHAGLTLDPVTGIISGTPMVPTTTPIFVTMSDGADGASVNIPTNIQPNYVSSFFVGEEAKDPVYLLQFPNGNYFGYYAYLSDRRFIYHFDLGYEYVFDAADGHSGAYFYDFKSGGFFYSSPTFPFPYLYDFSLNSVVYYYPDPDGTYGRYNTDGVRYFYVFGTGQILSK